MFEELRLRRTAAHVTKWWRKKVIYISNTIQNPHWVLWGFPNTCQSQQSLWTSREWGKKKTTCNEKWCGLSTFTWRSAMHFKDIILVIPCLFNIPCIFPEEEEGVGVLCRVAMMEGPPSRSSVQPAISEVKKTPENFTVYADKEDLLQYPNPKNVSEELPSANLCRHLEKWVLHHRQDQVKLYWVFCVCVHVHVCV